MKPTTKKVKEYSSLDEYKRKFYPEQQAEQIAIKEDPHDFGVNLARDLLKKYKHLISSQ